MSEIRPTDWDTYYSSKPGIARFTRKITTSKVINALRLGLKNGPFEISELGGGNSCIYDEICKSFPVKKFHIIDNNEAGLKLAALKGDSSSLETHLCDLTKSSPKISTDAVISLGLIEHFDKEGTKKMIETHIDLCKPGGVVLITFPTPTFLYRFLRSIFELLGIWKFWDERPLLLDEVAPTLSQQTEIIHEETIWWIGLTQKLVLARKK